MEFKPVVFKLGNEEYGVDIKNVQAIENVVPIVPIPNSNKDVLGIINLRGEVIPVYSIRSKFNMSKLQYTEDTKFVIVKSNNLVFALEVDKVDEIQNINDGMVHDMPSIVNSRDTLYARKVININGRLIVIINVENLLSDDEKEQLKQIVENM